MADTILERACRGDDEALCSLIASQENRVMAMCRAILRRAEWAEDAAQETFLHMVRALPRFDAGRQGFDTWLLTIARRVALSELRKRRPEEMPEDLPEPAAGESRCGEVPVDRLIAREDVERAVQALERLALPYREVLTMRFFHDLGAAEMAEVLGTTRENVRIRLFRAVREMRRLLA